MTSPPSIPSASRTYRPSTFIKIFFVFLGCVIAGLGLMIACSTANHRYREDQVFAICFGLFLFAISALIIRTVLRASVVLTSDTIEVSGLWSRSSLRLSEIRGRRCDGRTMTFFPKDDWRRNLDITGVSNFAFDDFYRNWLKTIPDLNAVDRDRQHVARERDLIQRRKEGKLRFYEKWMGLDTLPYDGAYIPISTPKPGSHASSSTAPDNCNPS